VTNGDVGRPSRLGIWVLVVLSAVAACGDDDEPSRAAGPTTTAAAGTVSSTSTTGNIASLTAASVLSGLRNDGRPIGDFVDYTAENDPNHQLGRPNGYTSKVNFRDTRLEKESDDFSLDDGGSIEVFANHTDATSRFEYVRSIASNAAMFNEYDYQEGRVLLRLSQRLTPAQAAEYHQSLKAAVSR